MQLRSATGSNRFQIGEVIPLEAVFSSSTPKRYLEPCELFVERNFGFALCRYFSSWSFSITPDSGWVDLTKEFPPGIEESGGPTFEVPDRDLTSQPVAFPYLLTKRFRFDTPGKYRVHLSTQLALDDENAPRPRFLAAAVKAHTVNVTADLEIEIVPASPEWQAEVIRKGSEAYSGGAPPNANPLSQELLQYQQATRSLCNLGTPEAARSLVGLLSRGHQEVQDCLYNTPSDSAAIEELQRLLVAPDVGVNPAFFSELTTLLCRPSSKSAGLRLVSSETIDRQREILVAALPQKRGAAQITSLLTVLGNSPRSKGTTLEPSYEVPFASPIISAVVANFDRFPASSQEWLLGGAWGRVRSPLMLPLVKRLAEAGNGQALLRWRELDPTGATNFIRKEVVLPVPRFSSFYLRLPESSLPGQEAEIAANFVALTQDQDLVRAATLLHRYATSAVLPVVLPFIDAQRVRWPCSVEILALAYLLKVSASDATPRVEQALREADHGPCNTLFTDLGFLEPSPVLERLARTQIELGTPPLARDAADYLWMHGSAAAKPFLWEQLEHWHKRYVASGAQKRVKDGVAKNDDFLLRTLVSALIQAFVEAQAWVLSPQEWDRMQTRLGDPAMSLLGCESDCGARFSIGPGPANYPIYGGPDQAWKRKQSPMEYLNSVERLHYSINQYSCPDIRALKEKILQFPVGSSFDFTWDLTAADRDELVEISDFLWSHGYKVRNPQNWPFLRADPPRPATSAVTPLK